jgi:hypothetical protein
MKWTHLLAMTPFIAPALVFAACSTSQEPRGTATESLAKAAFTTFDTTLQGCDNSSNGINCNLYDAKEDVFMNGGPTGNTLPDGTYFFAVLVPGFQNGGFLDGAKGNLSDTTAGGTAGDLGSGDLVGNRTFTMSGGVIQYSGTHALGTSPDGKKIIQLVPFDNTSNPGNVYILAICLVGATSPRDCKFDAFKAPPSAPHDAGVDAPHDAPPDVSPHDAPADVGMDQSPPPY